VLNSFVVEAVGSWDATHCLPSPSTISVFTC